MNYIIGQILISIGYILQWTSKCFKKKSSMVILDILNQIVSISGFLFMGIFNGVQNSIYAIIRGAVSLKVKDKKLRTRIITSIVMIFGCVLMYLSAFSGVSTLFTIGSSSINTISFIYLNEQGQRFSAILAGICYICFYFFTKNYSGFVCEIINISFAIGSLIFYKGKYEKIISFYMINLKFLRSLRYEYSDFRYNSVDRIIYKFNNFLFCF